MQDNHVTFGGKKINQALIIRKATPKDVDSVPSLILESSKIMLEYVFGTKSVQAFITYCFSDGRGIFGYPIQMVGTQNERVCISGSYYPSRKATRLILATILQAITFYKGSFFAIFWRLIKIRALFLPITQNTLYLANIAVHPDMRQQGIGTTYIANMLKRAKQDGYTQCELDVYKENASAQKLYIKSGFTTVFSQSYKGAFTYSGIIKMKAELSDLS
jgi:GNAT superfamily N-acetyltransferase